MGRAAEETGSQFAQQRMVIEHRYKQIATAREHAKLLQLATVVAIGLKALWMMVPIVYAKVYPPSIAIIIGIEVLAEMSLLLARPGTPKERLSFLMAYSIFCAIGCLQHFLSIYSYHMLWEDESKYWYLAGDIAHKLYGSNHQKVREFAMTLESGIDGILLLVLIVRWVCVHSLVLNIKNQKKDQKRLKEKEEDKKEK